MVKQLFEGRGAGAEDRALRGRNLSAVPSLADGQSGCWHGGPASPGRRQFQSEKSKGGVTLGAMKNCNSANGCRRLLSVTFWTVIAPESSAPKRRRRSWAWRARASINFMGPTSKPARNAALTNGNRACQAVIITWTGPKRSPPWRASSSLPGRLPPIARSPASCIVASTSAPIAPASGAGPSSSAWLPTRATNRSANRSGVGRPAITGLSGNTTPRPMTSCRDHAPNRSC